MTLEAVTDYLIDEKAHAPLYAAFFQKYGNLASRKDELISLEMSLAFGEITLSDAEMMAQQAFGFTSSQAQEFIIDFIGYFLLALREFIPETITAFEAKGGVASQYPKVVIPSENTSSSDQSLQKALALLPSPVESPVLEKRLSLILSQYARGERDASRTADMLARDIGIGGMGFAPDLAQSVVTAVTVPATAVPKEPISVKVADSPGTLEDDISLEIPSAFNVEERSEDLREIKELPPLTTASPVAEVPTIPSSAAIARPAAPVAEITHALATTIPVVNGDFITQDEADEVEEHRALAEEVERTTENDVMQLSNEAEKLLETLWLVVRGGQLTKMTFGTLIESVLRGVRTTPQLEQQLSERYKILPEQIEQVGKTLEAHIETRRNSYKKRHLEYQRILKETEERNRQQKAIEEKNLENPPKPLEPVKVEVSIPSVHPALHGEQKVTDIHYKKHTLGPIDELSSMTPADFRLLASRPQDLADIILAKIETIAEDGYEERLQSIQAWQQSPVNMLYVSLLREAMIQEKPLPDIVAAERAKGQEVLSPSEIDAVMAINKRLS